MLGLCSRWPLCPGDLRPAARPVLGRSPRKGLSSQMMDANQRWDVPEAVEWMAKLAEFKPLWIEEPTCPDDILGHAAISKVEKRLPPVWS